MVKNYTKGKPLRVFTAFSGYDSQCLALNRLGINYDLVGWSEIDPAAIKAHNALFPQYEERNYGDISKIDWSQVPDFVLFTYSSPCFVAGTLIKIKEGFKNIEDISVGDYVLTHTNTYKKVIETYVKEYYDDLCEIKLYGLNKPVVCTKNHPFYTYRDDEFKWIMAKDLNSLDFIAQVSNVRRFAPLVICGDLKEMRIDNHKCNKIQSFKIIHNESCYVYNLEVEDDHSYTANYFVVHNCTDFSNAGQQAGGEEGSGTRSSLLWECRKTILAKKPKYLLFENVKALVSDKFLYLFEKWCKELESYGYANYYQVLNSKDYGVPQSRERIFMVSILKTDDEPDPYYEFPRPVPLTKCVEDILEDNVPEKYYMKQEVTDRYIDIMNQEYPDDVGENIELNDEGLW